MTQIRCVYTSAPVFPATEQHPDAVRYAVGPYIVDAIGGAPDLAAVEVMLIPSVPRQVSRLQARVALHRAGLLAPIETAVAQAGGELQIYWTDAQTFERDSGYIGQIAAALGLTGDQIDQLFRDAAAVA